MLRVLWLSLPLTAGAAASDALEGWNEGPALLVAALAWIAWGAGMVAMLAPRPALLTALRAVAPTFAVVAVAAVAASETSGLSGWGAVAATAAGATLVALPDIAVDAANGIAYGDEQRFPLRVPVMLLLGPVAVVWALVVTGVTAGPLLLADGEVVWGLVALVVGAPVAAFGVRALHGLSLRWIILVPAGVVVVDRLTLAEPVLFVRRQVRALRPVPPGAPVASAALDLRLGAQLGTVAIALGEPAELMRAARGRQGGTIVRASTVVVAVVQRSRLLEAAARRRVRVEAR